MKTLRLIIFLTLYSFSYQAFSQADTFINGAYKNVGDFKSNSPLLGLYFKVDKVNHSKIPELYMITSTDNSIADFTIRKKIWGIYNKGTFYLNVERFGMDHGYVKFDTLLKYNYFRGVTIGAIKIRRDNTKDYISAVLFANVLAGLSGTGGANYTVENVKAVDYILDMETGLPVQLNWYYIRKLVEPYTDLRASFETIEDRSDIPMLLEYLKKVNEREK
jgi:hypothetical protein